MDASHLPFSDPSCVLELGFFSKNTSKYITYLLLFSNENLILSSQQEI